MLNILLVSVQLMCVPVEVLLVLGCVELFRVVSTTFKVVFGAQSTGSGIANWTHDLSSGHALRVGGSEVWRHKQGRS